MENYYKHSVLTTKLMHTTVSKKPKQIKPNHVQHLRAHIPWIRPKKNKSNTEREDRRHYREKKGKIFINKKNAYL